MGIGFGGFVPGVQAGIVPGALLIVFGVILVEHPFDHVAVHVVEAPGVGLFAANFLVFEIAVLFEPGVLSQLSGVIAKKIGGRSPGAAGVFPFGLRWEAKELAGLGAEPLAIFAGGVLCHGDRGVAVLAHTKAHFDIRFGGMGHGVGQLVARSVGRNGRAGAPFFVRIHEKLVFV